MLNSTTLEVAIGMALIYLLLSLFCTAINESVAGILGLRAKNLERGIRSLFTDGLKSNAGEESDGSVTPAVTLAQAVYDHGLVQSLYKSTLSEQSTHWYNKFGSQLPSYIPSRVFSSALLDILFPAGSNAIPANLAAMVSRVQALPESKGKQAILALITQAGGDITQTRLALEHWYDDGMDRVAGWYKRRTQLALFVIGLIVAVVLNVDSITIGRTLWLSPALRSYAITAAEQYAGDKSKTIPEASQDLSALKALALPIGWSETKYPWMAETGQNLTYTQRFSVVSLAIVVTGWLLTAIAMTLGAPFWFDTLNKFMVVRSTIKPREKSEDEASKDAQSK